MCPFPKPSRTPCHRNEHDEQSCAFKRVRQHAVSTALTVLIHVILLAVTKHGQVQTLAREVVIRASTRPQEKSERAVISMIAR